MSTTIVDPRLQRFGELVNQGIEAWVEAGRLLTEITADDPEAYTVILSENPHLTRDILLAFERIGRKEIYPYLIIDGSPGARMLAALPYESQVKLYTGKVRVVVKRGGCLEPIDKRVCDLTQPEAARAFDGDHIRPVAEQMKLMRPSVSHRDTHRVVEDSEPPPPVDSSVPSLDEDPKAELARQLSIVNTALLDARTALAMIQRESKWDGCISTALTAIGKLRFALNDGQVAA